MQKISLYKKKISKLGYFVRRDWPWQPILWQVHKKYFPRNNEFQMDFDTEHAFECEFLIKKLILWKIDQKKFSFLEILNYQLKNVR